MSDLVIIEKLKKGYSLKEIHDYYMTCEPCLDDLICLNHVLRICSAEGLLFSNEQAKRVFNKTFSREFHGSKTESWNFISPFLSNKLLIPKTERRCSKKLPVDPLFSEKEASSTAFSKQSIQSPINVLEGENEVLE